MCLLSLWMHFKDTHVETHVAAIQLWTDLLLGPPQCGCNLTKAETTQGETHMPVTTSLLTC
jgi:hypothetical protein